MFIFTIAQILIVRTRSRSTNENAYLIRSPSTKVNGKLQNSSATSPCSAAKAFFVDATLHRQAAVVGERETPATLNQDVFFFFKFQKTRPVNSQCSDIRGRAPSAQTVPTILLCLVRHDNKSKHHSHATENIRKKKKREKHKATAAEHNVNMSTSQRMAT